MASIYQKVIQCYAHPGYDQVVLDVSPKNGLINLKYGDIIQRDGRLTSYKIGSVIGYALDSGDDPIEWYERAKENGHDLHWANQQGVCISASGGKRPPDHIQVKTGQLVNYEGLVFRLDPAPNDNIKLVEVGKIKYTAWEKNGSAAAEYGQEEVA
jgi:hypothetical protein